MSFTADHLYELLPAVYRVRDAALAPPGQRGPLYALVSVIADQAAVLEENLAQLYDDQFIETCASWVVPYIGELIDFQLVRGDQPMAPARRAEVAHTIGYRRRKGTATMLEQLARDATGWDAHVVEFFLRLATTQFMNHIRADNPYSPDLRQWQTIELLGTPFDRTARTIDVRRIERGGGAFNIHNVGVYLWRLTPYRLTDSPAVAVDERRFRFHPLGIDAPLVTAPVPRAEITLPATPLNVPMPISRRSLHENPGDYYGASILIRVGADPVDVSMVRACDLSDVAGGKWGNMPDDFVGIDPQLGRFAFGARLPTPKSVNVTFRYAFSADMGGGEYSRISSDPPTLSMNSSATIQSALDSAGPGSIIEIADSGRYEEKLTIDAPQGLTLRAKDGHRPTLVLKQDLQITGDEGAEVTLSGLLIAGGAIRIEAGAENRIARLNLVDCTLVPGRVLDHHSNPLYPTAASISANVADLVINIDRCITGPIRVSEEVTLNINDSIVDACHATSIAITGVSRSTDAPGGPLTVQRCTVIGQVHTRVLELASECIFIAETSVLDEPSIAPVRSDQKQMGCVRFCSIPPGSRVPRRFHCQPDLAVAELARALKLQSVADLSQSQRDAVTAQVQRASRAFIMARRGIVNSPTIAPPKSGAAPVTNPRSARFMILNKPRARPTCTSACANTCASAWRRGSGTSRENHESS